MKKFICISPFQPPERLGAGIYTSANSDVLIYNKEVSFPIIPVINGYTKECEEIAVITVVADYENTKVNYNRLQDAVSELAREKSIRVNFQEIYVPYDSSLEVQIKIFSRLSELISDGDKLYCDITYGTKVMSQILTMGVNYGYRVNNDVIIGCIAYGEKDHNSNNMKIYDITSLTYLDEIVRVMAEKGVGDPSSAINMLINPEDEADG